MIDPTLKLERIGDGVVWVFFADFLDAIRDFLSVTSGWPELGFRATRFLLSTP
jgi:hypothetical protein